MQSKQTHAKCELTITITIDVVYHVDVHDLTLVQGDLHFWRISFYMPFRRLHLLSLLDLFKHAPILP